MTAWLINVTVDIWRISFVKNKAAAFIATYCGFGLSPKAPGTVGSLATLPLAFVICYYFGLTGLLIAAFINQRKCALLNNHLKTLEKEAA